MDAAHKSGVAREVVDDAKVCLAVLLPQEQVERRSGIQQSLATALKKAATEAERVNDMIYHLDIPPASSIPRIKGTVIVREDLVVDPISQTASDELIFAKLESWGITRACGAVFVRQARRCMNNSSHPVTKILFHVTEIYRDRRENWIDNELVETQHELDQALSRYDTAECTHPRN
jgi:programmed cell death 6-interacting protein